MSYEYLQLPLATREMFLDAPIARVTLMLSCFWFDLWRSITLTSEHTLSQTYGFKSGIKGNVPPQTYIFSGFLR